MKVLKIFLVSLFIAMNELSFADTSAITIDKVIPISPWAVQIDYLSLGGNFNDPLLIVSNTATHQVHQANKNAIKGNFQLRSGRHSIRWNLMEDSVMWDRCNVALGISEAAYCVIDLSAGANATSYPVTYLYDTPSGGWKDEHKTTKLVLRFIKSGAFLMNGSYGVRLTKNYYIGVFEVTQKQYQLVTGNNPSRFLGDQLPVESVSWDMIRAETGTHDWPTEKTVDSNSFVGRLRARTGLEFDLPTEAQWEYACRAGTRTTYSYGDSANDFYMWYISNSNQETHEVGTKRPNAWGLYDMHGNVFEWCLDWYGELSGGKVRDDPVGPSSGDYCRVLRGGCYFADSEICTSSFRYNDRLWIGISDYGFRLVRNLSK